MLKHHEPFTLERKVNLLENVQFIGLMASLIQVEFQSNLVDSKFKNPAVNQHAKRIKESSHAIEVHLSSIVNLKDRESFAYSVSTEMIELIKHFLNYPPEKIREFMDRIRELNNQGREA